MVGGRVVGWVGGCGGADSVQVGDELLRVDGITLGGKSQKVRSSGKHSRRAAAGDRRAAT